MLNSRIIHDTALQRSDALFLYHYGQRDLLTIPVNAQFLSACSA